MKKVTEQEIICYPERYLYSEEININWDEVGIVSGGIFLVACFIAIPLWPYIIPLSIVTFLVIAFFNYCYFSSIKATRRIIESSPSWKLLSEGIELFGRDYVRTKEGLTLLVEVHKELGLLSLTVEQERERQAELKLEIYQHLKTKEEIREMLAEGKL